MPGQVERPEVAIVVGAIATDVQHAIGHRGRRVCTVRIRIVRPQNCSRRQRFQGVGREFPLELGPVYTTPLATVGEAP